jgi:DNA-binding beta-propeller fold protein YncE
MRKLGGELWMAAAAALCALSLTAGAAKAAPSDPLFLFSAPPSVPPGTGFEGPCGVAVDSKGRFYVSDYYHGVVDVFSVNRAFLFQIANIDSVNRACGLAVDSTDKLYVNHYHRYVSSGGAGIDFNHPTGIAVDPASDYLYVNRRTEIALYDPSGERVFFEGQPLALGLGSLGDAYGLAVSGFPSTAGRIYVADAREDVVKVYDLATDKVNPVQVIAGGAIAGGGFHSLKDSAIAVDRVTGQIYVSDSLHPAYTERPEATIHVFSHAGGYQGHLKYNVVDARPVGLAVDNSPGGAQGRVYVTSGNSEGAFLYGYPPGAATSQPPLCAPGGFCPSEDSGGAGLAGSGPSPLASALVPQGPDARGGGAQASELTQEGSLRLAMSGRLAPKRLPRKGTAPIAVTVGGQISTTDESRPPQLKELRIEINRHGRLDYTGLPTCPYERIQPASTARALSACRSALVGEGSFEAEITLAGQAPYPTSGRLLVFNGLSRGKPVLFGQIYAPRPFATSFVIVFAIRKLRGGTYGTELAAHLPRAMGSWGNLTAIEMRLSRRYTYRGKRRSYLSAGCPAPEGFGRVVFPLARASFGFAGGTTLSSTLQRSCRARG